MGGTRLVVPTGCVQDIESGGALEIGGTKYIDTSGKIVQQYESKTSDDGGEALTNYGVSYLSPVALASTFILPTGTANVVKVITVGNGSTATAGGAAVTVKSSGCAIIDASSSTSLATITGTAYQSGSINLIAESTAVWRVIGKPSTSLALS